jgi:SAM-dependent methyltransferase
MPDVAGSRGAGPLDRSASSSGRDGLGFEVRRYYRAIAPFLDEELSDRGDGAFWTWAASRPAACRVLELGCGTGRATAFLAREAGRVVALDLSLDLLARARGRLAGRRNVALLAADMRRLPLNLLNPLDPLDPLNAEFDLVVAIDDPFVHLTEEEDREQALREAARHLAPCGRLILDAAWFPPRQRKLASGPGGWVTERVHRGEGGPAGEASLTVREQWRCDPANRLCTARYTYLRGNVTLGESSCRARLWSVAELLRRVRGAGLELLALWGDYDRRPWSRASSPRLIVAAARAARP